MSDLTGRTTIVVGALDPFGYEWEFSQPIAVTHECRSVERTIRMTEAESLFGEEHVRRHRETNGEVGHIWHGSKVLLLTTKGRNSGEPRTTPLAYDRVGDNFVVLASNGGAPEHPGWYRNLAKEPQVEVQVKARSSARTLGPRRALSGSASGRSRRDSTPTSTGTRRGRNERSRLLCSSTLALPHTTRRFEEAQGETTHGSVQGQARPGSRKRRTRKHRRRRAPPRSRAAGTRKERGRL